MRLATISFITLIAFLFSSLTNATSPNRIAGTWRLLSASSTTNNVTTPDLWGQPPYGLLTFTPCGYQNQLLMKPNLPRFASDSDRTSGTAEQNAAVMDGVLAISGTYTVDKNGDFESQHVLASSFPNWVGLERGTDVLELVVSDDGDRMVERFQPGGDLRVDIVWERLE